MRPFERHQNATRYVRSFLLRSLIAFGLFAIMLLTARGAWEMYRRFAASAQESRVAQAQLQALAQRKDEVSAAVQAFSTDRGVEAQVRERYGVAKPGEGKIEIVRSDAVEASSTPPASGNIFMKVIKALFVW